MLRFNSRPAPRRRFSAAEADGRNSKTLLPKVEIHPLETFFGFLHLNTSRSRQLFFFLYPFLPNFFLPHQHLEFGLWMVMCPSGFTPLLCRFSSPLAGFGRLGSSFGQVDDRHPLIHAAALSAEPVHFAQSGILPQRRMWTL